MERRRIVFRGTVQGVGFRAACAAAARSLPIAGWARNEPDGTVLVEAQGNAEAIDALMNAIRRRMGRYIVHEESIEIPVLPDEGSFEIRR